MYHSRAFPIFYPKYGEACYSLPTNGKTKETDIRNWKFCIDDTCRKLDSITVVRRCEAKLSSMIVVHLAQDKLIYNFSLR